MNDSVHYNEDVFSKDAVDGDSEATPERKRARKESFGESFQREVFSPATIRRPSESQQRQLAASALVPTEVQATAAYAASHEKSAVVPNQAPLPTPNPVLQPNEMSIVAINAADSDMKYETIKDEDLSGDELALIDPDEIEIAFLSSTGEVLETTVIADCNTVDDFFLESVAAGMIQNSDEKRCLSIKIAGVPGWELRLLKRHTAKQLDKLKAKLEQLCREGKTGIVEVRIL